MNMGKASMPDPVKQPDPVKVPSPDDPDLVAARLRKMREEFAGRQGRRSTDLSGDGTAYSRTTLG